ncbi:hypothetical protein G6F63_013900 [Rhizopus arrhizus]|nr:hypothetical protein G6F63_013900 [Rhizopus arrhizus]
MASATGSAVAGLLDRGENLFRRNAFKSILIARYVGAIRPFVPAIAGMMKMPASRYMQASGIASISWAVLFLAPGWVLGEAYDAVAAVAGRLVVVVGLLMVILGLVWAIVLYGYRWSAARMDNWLARLLDWSNRHPTLGRYTVGVLDPKRRESVPLAMLALMLLVLGWGWPCWRCATRWPTTRWRRWRRWAPGRYCCRPPRRWAT